MEEDFDGPEDDDVTTGDHENFYRSERLWLVVSPNSSPAAMWKRIDAQMKRDGFFPNVWFISDHGNAHIMERPKRKGGSAYSKEARAARARGKIAKIFSAADKKYGRSGSYISGGFYDHWPESVKDKIRKLRHG